MVLPNQLTVLRIILTPIFLYLFLSGDVFLQQISLVVFIVAAITDWYDGWLARKFNYITEWGKFMDPLADKFLTSAAFFALAAIGILEYWMVWLIVLRDFFITGLRSYAEFKGKSFPTSLAAKWKTFIQMIFLYYLLVIITLKTFESLQTNFSTLFSVLLNETMIYFVMLGITLYTLITAVLYMFDNRQLIKKLFIK